MVALRNGFDVGELQRRRFSRLAPERPLPVSQWADRYRFLSQEASAIPGEFRISKTPFMREVSDNMGDPGVPELRTMKSSQVAYSESFNNYLARQIHQNPGPMLLILPDIEAAEDYSRDRIETMIRDTPVLRDLSPDRGNKILKKVFPGGDLRIVGANSPKRLASKPARDVIIDEEDRLRESSGKEGNPEKLAARRQITFPNRKMIVGGTPVLKGFSRTEKGFKKGDQRRYMVKCPCCGDHISLEVEHLQKNRNRPHYAEFRCPECAGWIKHEHKFEMIRDIPLGGEAYWSPAFGERMGGDEEREIEGRLIDEEDYWWNDELGRYVAKDSRVHSYYIWSAYSPFLSWFEICEEYNDALGDPETLKTVYNTLFGLPFEFTTNDLDYHLLFASREEWDDDAIPAGVRVITAGIDTQDNRFEVILVGWGADEEAWVLDFFTVEGDPDDVRTRANLRRELTKREFTTEEVDGKSRTLRVRGYMVDSGGHRTDSVYKFCRGRHFEKGFACKGLSTPANPIFSGFSFQKEAKIRLARVGTDTAKEAIYAKLAKDPEESGRIHFAGHLSLEFFQQLVAEEKVVELVRGQPRIKYKKKTTTARNEVLDCFVYAFASLRSMRLNLRKKSRRMKLAHDREAKMAREIEEAEEASKRDKGDADSTAEEPKVEKRKPKRRGKVTKMSRGPGRRRRR